MSSRVSNRVDADKRRRRRQKRQSDDEEDEDQEEILPRWKIIMVFALIGICFAMLMPSLFGPVFSSIFGRREGSQPQTPPDHPAMRAGANRGDRAPRPPRPPMPGGRMGFDNQPQQASTSKNIYSAALPLVSIGAMAFMIYTIFKMKSKKKRKRRGYAQESDGSDSESGGLGRRNLRSIQDRLLETELAMSKILEQLEVIAKEAPEGATVESLSAKFSAEQIAEMENNIQELNRLSRIRDRHQKRLEDCSEASEGELNSNPSDSEEDETERAAEISAPSTSNDPQRRQETVQAQEAPRKEERVIKTPYRRKRRHDIDNAGPDDDDEDTNTHNASKPQASTKRHQIKAEDMRRPSFDDFVPKPISPTPEQLVAEQIADSLTEPMSEEDEAREREEEGTASDKSIIDAVEEDQLPVTNAECDQPVFESTPQIISDIEEDDLPVTSLASDKDDQIATQTSSAPLEDSPEDVVVPVGGKGGRQRRNKKHRQPKNERPVQSSSSSSESCAPRKPQPEAVQAAPPEAEPSPPAPFPVPDVSGLRRRNQPGGPKKSNIKRRVPKAD